VELGHDQVLVVARLAGQVVVVALARRPLERHLGAVEPGHLPDQQLAVVGRVARGRRAVQAVQLEAGRAQVLQLVTDPGHRERGQAGASRSAVWNELVSKVMSWSTNWPK
jgi:hypothetical protein